MICNKCKKDIDDNSKFCGYCGNTINEKKKINKKIIIWISIPIIIIVAVTIALLMINSDKKNKQEDTKELYSFSELKFLNQINTNEMFDFLDSAVNSELIGTYAILTKHNDLEDTYDIIALKEDNTTTKIATTQYSSWANGIRSLFYSDGKIYYEYEDDTIWSIDLTEGNGNYNLKEYDFLEGYIYDYSWFYVINNKIYYFNTGALRMCDLTTEECEAQIIDYSQSIFKFKIDGKEMNLDFDNVYIENNKYIYILSEDEENIYKIDIENPTIDLGSKLASYTKVNQIGENAELVSDLSNKLTFKDLKIYKGHNDNGLLDYFIEYKNKRYNLEDYDLEPITFLPNNYLMVEYFNYEELNYWGEIKYINLKNGLIDENYSLEFEEYYDHEGESAYFDAASIYYITKQ